MSSPSNESTTLALACLKEMRDEFLAQKEKSGSCTLAYWRLSDPEFFQALKDFATAPDWKHNEADETDCRREAQALFTLMNLAMAKQERSILWPNDQGPTPNPNQWSVVFAGKWAVQPTSIAEQLVYLLCGTGGGKARVYTVSRTSSPQNPTDAPPANVVHFSKVNLEEPKLGKGEFLEVLNKVIDDWEAEYGKGEAAEGEKVPVVIYFTLAKHKGKHLPFQKNIQGAKNFVEALEEIVPGRLIPKGIPWKVVVTGTDATLPSTSEDKDLGTIQGIPTTAPTYKMLPHNTVYAASKLHQFFSIATAVSSMAQISVPPLASSRSGNDGSLATITKQLEDFVFAAGANGVYQENEFLTDKELDAISNYWIKVVEPTLHENLQTAQDISICYTPLHRDPWTSMCLTDTTKESPKKFFVQNIMWRLKNAISTDRAARAHL